jgi:leucyl-tRNA synthetase
MIAEERVTIVVQVNGKVRDRIEVAAESDEESVRQTALSSPGVQRHLNGQEIREIIIIPGKLVNIVSGR